MNIAIEERTPIAPLADGRPRDQLNIVIVGHVDHGKSTVIGRLLADTGSLPEGKLEAVRELCARTARPFEYAFLLDALKDERSQGITIDSARCFFKTDRRDYIIIDAPGHVEFLKNMVTGAARAEAALLVICASEGIQENSKRHGYLMSMLGIRQVVVLMNKMDLVNYDEGVYESIRADYSAFLAKLGVEPVSFIPISARDGVNLITPSAEMPWYRGPSVLEQLERFDRRKEGDDLPLRLPVQDIYKFTEHRDDRRIVAGTIESGVLRAGDRVVFLPSFKTSRIRSIESFNTPEKKEAGPGEAVGVTLETQVYVRPGEVMTRADDAQPLVSARFRAHVFWMSRSPLVTGRRYKLKIAAHRTVVGVAEIIHVMDASSLALSDVKRQIDRHDVGEVILETAKPIAFDPATTIAGMGRFVIVDNYEIAGGGVILGAADVVDTLVDRHIRRREELWGTGTVTAWERSSRNGHGAKFVVFTGEDQSAVAAYATELERRLFADGRQAYYLGVKGMLAGIGANAAGDQDAAAGAMHTLGELARVLTDAGILFISSVGDADDYDLELLKLLNRPAEIIVIGVGVTAVTRYVLDLPLHADMTLDEAMDRIYGLLRGREVLTDYAI